MEKFVYFNALFDIYKELLTQKEQNVFSYYYEENLSLGEIAELLNVSRSAIGNTVKIVEKKLEKYESILKIYNRNQKLKELCSQIKDKKLRKALEEFI